MCMCVEIVSEVMNDSERNRSRNIERERERERDVFSFLFFLLGQRFRHSIQCSMFDSASIMYSPIPLLFRFFFFSLYILFPVLSGHPLHWYTRSSARGNSGPDFPRFA